MKKKEKEREIKIGEITAWRCWRIRKHPSSGEDEYTSMFLSSNKPWPKDRGIYYLDHFFHDFKKEQSILDLSKRKHYDVAKYGFHAWKTKGQAIKYGYGEFNTVFGQVELYGKVVEHKRGYTAEWARIKDPENLKPILRVPITWYEILVVSFFCASLIILATSALINLGRILFPENTDQILFPPL